jgi:hypothetical protein
MSKVVKIAAIVVGVVAMAIPVVGQIVGTATLAAALGVSVGTLATIATIASVTATVLGVVAGVLTKPPKLKSDIAGQQLEWSADPSAGEPYALGDTMIGASIVHQASWGTKNKNLGIIGALSICTIFAYDGLYADMTQVSFSSTTHNAIGYFHDHLYLNTQLGATPEAAALTMTAPDATAMPDWGAAYKTSGIATAGMILVADIDNGKIYSGGTPKLTNRVRGVLAYDPRADSTQPGGSGAQRALTESTYAYSDNPWVHAATYALGRWQSGKKVIGPGLAPAQIDFASYMEAASVADANGWKISGLIYSSDGKWDVLKAMAQAGGGFPMPAQARLSCLVNAPKVSIATITEADVKGAVTAPQMLIRRDRLNGAIPRIRTSDHGWEVTPLVAVRNATYLAADDGNEKTREVDLPLVSDNGNGAGKNQAAQLAAYAVANSRERTGISVELGYQWSQYKPGDCLTLDLPGARLSNQKCIVIGRTINVAKNTITLQFQTEDDAKHTWALGVTGTANTPPTIAQAPGTGDTNTNVLGIDDPPQRLSFKYDYTGAPQTNEFSRDLTFKLYNSAGQITDGITWTYQVLTGTVNGFTSASAAQSMAGIGTGTLTVSSLGTSEAKVQVTASINGSSYVKTVTLSQDMSLAPVGASGALASKTSGFASINSTTFIDDTGAIAGTVPSGKTAATVAVALDFTPNVGISGAWTVEVKVMRDISGTPTQIGTTQSNSSDWDDVDKTLTPASFAFSIADTGLTAGTTYNWRVYARLTSGSRTHSVTGTVTVTA